MTMQQLGHDLLRATRAVSRSPQFTIAVISVLALGAGAPIVVLQLFSSSVPIVVPVDKESLYEIWRGRATAFGVKDSEMHRSRRGVISCGTVVPLH